MRISNIDTRYIHAGHLRICIHIITFREKIGQYDTLRHAMTILYTDLKCQFCVSLSNTIIVFRSTTF